MANTLLTPSVIAKMALATLYNNTVMAGLVHRDYEEEFVAKVGTTVTIRKPSVFTANDFNRVAGITIQNAVETGIPVVLNKHKDVSFAVTDHDLTMSVVDFGAQFVDPAMEAISQAVDIDILAERANIVQRVGIAGGTTVGITGTNAWDADNPRVSIDADRVLNSRSVPVSDRHLVVGPTTKSQWLGNDLLTRADHSGSTDALRDASLGGKVYSFSPYMTQNISGANEECLAFHRSAIALVTRPLSAPKGANNVAFANYKGLTLRVIMDYDVTHKQDVVSIDMLYGVKTLDANRACIVSAV